MKVLYVDLLSPIGHKNYNYGILDSLSKLCDIDVAARKDYLNLKDQLIPYGKYYEIPEKLFPESIARIYNSKIIYKILYRLNLYRAVSWINKILSLGEYDLVIFSSIEIISFALSSKFIKNRCLIIDHLIADSANSLIRKFFWQRLNSNIEIIVMEEYIRDFLINDINVNNKIWIVKHPFPRNSTKFKNDEKNQGRIIFAPSASNDEVFIEHLISNYEKINNYKIVIKSKERIYEKGNLKVYNNRLTDMEYDSLIANSEYILIPYDDNYNYRNSGVFFEAICARKKCIIKTSNTLKFIAEKYPKIIKGFKNDYEFWKVLSSDKSEVGEQSFNEVIADYSDEVITEQIKQALNEGEL